MTTCAYRIGTLAIAAVLLGLAGPAMAAEDLCAHASGDIAIRACTRDIESGRYAGRSLAIRYNNRGSEYSGKHDYESAIADYNSALRLDPQYADAYYNRCLAYNRKDDFEEALADCNKAISLGPTPNALNATGQTRLTDDRSLSDYYTQRGLALYGKHSYERAIADFNQALRLHSENATALRNRGRTYEAQGDSVRAEADYALAKSMEK